MQITKNVKPRDWTQRKLSGSQGLSRYARQAQAIGIEIFGGSGSGSLRYVDGPEGKLIVTDIDGHVDGGDGGSLLSDDGLLRGEF